ncbi:Hypothetical predicted protein, partial [Pelobates cultripes]
DGDAGLNVILSRWLTEDSCSVCILDSPTSLSGCPFKNTQSLHSLCLSKIMHKYRTSFMPATSARPKYLRCIAISCFFLAAKTSEEDE